MSKEQKRDKERNRHIQEAMIRRYDTQAAEHGYGTMRHVTRTGFCTEPKHYPLTLKTAGQ